MKSMKFTLAVLASLIAIGTSVKTAVAQTKTAANPLDPQTIAVEDFDYHSLDSSTRKVIDSAPATGLKMLQAKTAKLGKKVNGWEMLLGTFGSYGIEYLQRVAVALFGLGCNQPADAVYPQLLTDADGRPLTGASQYVMHFEKDELPPAEAFWSFTLYDKDGFAVPNALNRATLSSWMDLKYNADGSIDLYFQAESPGKDKEANWLPSPCKVPGTCHSASTDRWIHGSTRPGARVRLSWLSSY
jgi:hypothetical protein